MKIKKVIETENGEVEFTANLVEEELQLVLDVGLNILFAHGSVPFLSAAEVVPSSIQPSTDTVQ